MGVKVPPTQTSLWLITPSGERQKLCAPENHKLYKNAQSKKKPKKQTGTVHTKFQILSNSVTHYKDVYFFLLKEITKQNHANYLLSHNYTTNSHYCKNLDAVILIHNLNQPFQPSYSYIHLCSWRSSSHLSKFLREAFVGKSYPQTRKMYKHFLLTARQTLLQEIFHHC